MRPVTGFLLVTVLCSSIRFAESQMLRREAYATVPQLVTEAGYPIEKHRAKTSDGYILQLHRIPAGRRVPRRSDPRAKGKRAVLLIHGLLGSSSDFIIMGPDRSLGYILADAGYDVWLGNLRGNQHTAHQNLTRNDPAFWNYCFHEHGKYDVPAMIDRVLEITGLTKLLYIGYSMGTTSFFTMVSQNPDYNDKIVAFVALAPAVYMDNIRYLTEFFFKTLNITDSMRARGVLSFNLRPDVVDQVVGNMCKAKDAQQDMCFRWIYSIVGEDYEQNDWNLSPVILARLQPASWRQLEHFGKISMTGVFTKWEDGMYGAVKPYNLSRVNIPVTLLYGKNDQLTEKHQIMRLAKELNSTGVLESVRPGSDWHKFNHLDFVFAKDIGKLLNKPLVRHIDKLYDTYGP